MDTTRTTGKTMEALAQCYLEQHQIKTYKTNFRSKMGEIDLISFDPRQKILIFVEVRFRKNAYFGGPLFSVTYQKQKKLIKTAKYFILQYTWARKWSCRFDVIGITNQPTGPHIEWVQDAFRATL